MGKTLHLYHCLSEKQNYYQSGTLVSDEGSTLVLSELAFKLFYNCQYYRYPLITVNHHSCLLWMDKDKEKHFLANTEFTTFQLPLFNE